MKTTFKLIIYIFTFLALSANAYAAASTSDPFPPAAQEALNKGIIAAKLPDYLLAIHYFEEARKIAPKAPVIYLNMGLAESRIPGRELRAIAWFGAYLAANHDAPNAVAVKEQISMLEVKNRSNVFRLLKSTQDAASQLSGNEKSSALHDVAWLFAKAGDIPAALKIASLIESTGFQRSARDNIADVKAYRDGSRLMRPGDLPTEAPDYYSLAVLKPSFWVNQLECDDRRYGLGIALNTAPFLDLADYLASGHFLDVMKPFPLDQDPNQISANDLSSPRTIFYGFYATTQTLALAQYEIDRMLKMLFAELPR